MQLVNIFINNNNTIYVNVLTPNVIFVWPQEAHTPNITIHVSTNTFGVFASDTGDVFIDNGNTSGTVNRWTSSTTSTTVVMRIDDICYGMFIDVYNYLYCAVGSLNRVVKKSLSDVNTNTSTTIAGNGTSGSASNMLRDPRRIFVTVNLDLYVADYGNNRIQLFRSGQLNATTLVGNGTLSSIPLSSPTAIVVDADDNVFICDHSNNRIIRWSNSVTQCLFGCSNTGGSGANQLNKPRSLIFDSYGNLYVVDTDNNRIQKFSLLTNTCGE